jgi:D-sedoheptulose 7-phosphate isomerase
MNGNLLYIEEFKTILDKLPIEVIDGVINAVHDARLNGRRVFIMGNGGSASTASHMVCDLAKNTKREGWPSLKVIGLADNMAIFSALANDEGYETVFAQQLSNLIEEKDIVIGISASGNSMNVVNAIQLANESRAVTIGFTGFDGGKLGQLVQVHLHVPSDCIEMVEDIHLMLDHMITKALKNLSAEPMPTAEAVI